MASRDLFRYAVAGAHVPCRYARFGQAAAVQAALASLVSRRNDLLALPVIATWSISTKWGAAGG